MAINEISHYFNKTCLHEVIDDDHKNSQVQSKIISDSLIQNWTLQAIECYNLRGNCKNCSISKGSYSFVCQMPKVVTYLLNTNGPPTNYELKPRHLD